MNHLGTPGIWGKTVFLRSMQLRRNPPGRSPKWLHTRIRILAPDALHKGQKDLWRRPVELPRRRPTIL